MMATLIAKEDVPLYKIVPAFVDNTVRWLRELQYATRLGNEFKSKTHITFETTEGARSISTTVWSVTDRFVQIKGGTNIPLNSILDVHF
ncbi:MAG: hypothetical protein BGO70_11850 [Bacteroidetes bacterium 43-93]|jgi:hypothetical protein|nr:hypothetical protein [Bacteroidota bacterium]MBS1781267.1 hypothetical protein [Bacteroidota bacterium]OJW98153.1 MAG: hypothetical protein BGO70_11850 [Bacteroidetes bacterium 43-93]